MRFLMLELPGEPALHVRLHHRMTVVAASGDAERDRIAGALAGLSDGAVWADDADGHPIGRLSLAALADLGVDPHLAAGMVLRAADLLAPDAGDDASGPDAPPAPDAARDAAADRARLDRREHLEGRRRALTGRSTAQALPFHRFTVQAALDALRRAEEQAAVDADRAAELTRQWNAVADLIADLPPLRGTERVRLETARGALEVARREVEIRKSRGPVRLGPEDVLILDQLHAEVTRAQTRAERPFPGSAVRRRLQEVEEAEAAFLAQFGFSSYSAYLLHGIDGPVGDEPPGLAAAQALLAEAEGNWESVQTLADHLRQHEVLEAEAARLRAVAAGIVGEELLGDVPERLADWAASSPALAAALSKLEAALAGASVDPADDAAATAAAWLVTQDDYDRIRQAAEAELADIDAELAGIDAALAAPATAPDVVAAPAPVRAAVPEGERLEMHLLNLLAAHRWVGPVGSLPVVLDDALAGIPTRDRLRALDLLERMSSSVQVVYLTTAPEVADWAATLGKARVELSRPLPGPGHDDGSEPADGEAAEIPVAEPAQAETAQGETAQAANSDGEAAPIDEAPAPAAHTEPASIDLSPAPAAHAEPARIDQTPAPAAHAEPVGDEPVQTQAAAEPVRRPLCNGCWHAPSVATCDRCSKPFCDGHLVKLRSRPPLCVSCAVVAAGVRAGRR